MIGHEKLFGLSCTVQKCIRVKPFSATRETVDFADPLDSVWYKYSLKTRSFVSQSCVTSSLRRSANGGEAWEGRAQWLPAK